MGYLYEKKLLIKIVKNNNNKFISSVYQNCETNFCIRMIKLVFFFYNFRNPNFISTEEQQNENLRGRYEKIVWPPYEPVHQKYLSIGKFYLNILFIVIIL